MPDEALAYIQALTEQNADDPVIAFYQELAPQGAVQSQPFTPRENT